MQHAPVALRETLFSPIIYEINGTKRPEHINPGPAEPGWVLLLQTV